MTTDLIIFIHPKFGPIRWRITEDGSPRFIAADACRILELGNVSQALSHLDDDEKGITIADTLGGPQRVVIR